MPAAAVIPAPIVYIKVAAVKKLVVGFRSCRSVVSLRGCGRMAIVIIKVHHSFRLVCTGC